MLMPDGARSLRDAFAKDHRGRLVAYVATTLFGWDLRAMVLEIVRARVEREMPTASLEDPEGERSELSEAQRLRELEEQFPDGLSDDEEDEWFRRCPISESPLRSSRESSPDGRASAR